MPKLPADLPENWTQGQTISPNGTEVGLTEQHGYNYLMKQVNNTQTEVNGINDALPDVAQEATVAEINDKIGTESDADTQPTLFGRLAELKKVLTEKLAELLTKVTGMDGKIGTAADGAEQGTLFGKINDISDTMPIGAVKSVQRGFVNLENKSYGYTTIDISEIDPDKSIVILNGIAQPQNTAQYVLVELNSTSIKISHNSMSETPGIDYGVSWQVVEFF